MTGYGSGLTGRDLADVDTSELAFPATACRPTPWGRNILDQQQYSPHNPRYMVS
jgi:hypothetical protein